MTRDLDPERDDAALLEAHVAGDPDAFGVLFHRHRDRLWAVALRTTGSPEEAADALQDAMISAFRRAGSFRGDAAVTTWLHRIVVNACLDRLRRRKVRATDPLPDDLEDHAARGALVTGGSLLDSSTGTAGDPEARALAQERRRVVLDALDHVPPEQRAALVLVDMEAYPVQEAARILDVPVGTVKSRCARGRARLAVLLADLDGTTGARGTSAGDGASKTTSRPGSRATGPPPGPPGGVDPPGSLPRRSDHTRTRTPEEVSTDE